MVDRNRDARSPVLPSSAVLVGTLLCMTAPHVSFAAAGLSSGCDSIARELKSAEIPVEILTIDVVDHMTEDHGALESAIGHEQDPTAPLLFLTPRVAHILQDVFGDAAATEPKLALKESVREAVIAAAAASKREPEPQTAAGGGPAKEFDATRATQESIAAGPLSETLYDVDTLPQFQQRMYRNDI